ncbi:membrane protein [Tenacibaculum holothuriorum]|uniref:Membrane protein n=1 Tax=Tenacibaculum holothuriorum TaxID=1635173 RepID=A0A1Y2PDP1_9FLAO|nr:rhomboid family intramembrane serine protease [Tenacibaculum holothuriorum]OSY88606.1 membrane protein [Tenacibaculum holothuriorum]
MKTEGKLKYSNSIFLIPFLLVFSIWLIYYLEIRFGWNFNKFGVFPRKLNGFKGVFFTHFIHSSTKHLFNNSVPLFVLTTSLFYFYREVAGKVLIYGALITGFFTWVIGRESYHIGASGVVYLLFSFVFFSGIIKKHFRLTALSLIIIFLYGSMIWYIFPVKEGMSWEGHLSGFLVGLFFAFLYRKTGIVKEEFVFTKTEFDDMFDENGNYVPPQESEEEEVTNTTQDITFLYEIKKNED